MNDRVTPSQRPRGKDIRCAVYFVATPLHYLCARRIARDHEAGAKQVLVCYSRALDGIVEGSEWDEVVVIPWPRFEPLPGPFGRHRRLLENVRRVGQAVGPCGVLYLHSPVFDTEAINYFLRALPKLCRAREMHARVIPDGLLNLQRHPLGGIKRLAQRARTLRRLAHPLLDYWCFAGDRIGSDAPFVDRIYVLAGFPHAYPATKVVTLAPLIDAPSRGTQGVSRAPVALIVGQPLVRVGLMSREDCDVVTREIARWLADEGIGDVVYKAHPRDRLPYDLKSPEHRLLSIDEPIETHMAAQLYTVVVGCCSTVLFLARQIYGPDVRILSFGLDHVRFKDDGKHKTLTDLMEKFAIEIH
jgi:hypothetical protein